DPDDHVAVLRRRLHCLVDVVVGQVGVLVGLGGEANAADVEVGDEARPYPLDVEATEARPVKGAGAAGVDRGDDPTSRRDWVDVDSPVRRAPVGVNVQVDQTGRDVLPRNVDDLTREARRNGRLDRGDLSVRDRQVASVVEPQGRVEDGAAVQ